MSHCALHLNSRLLWTRQLLILLKLYNLNELGKSNAVNLLWTRTPVSYTHLLSFTWGDMSVIVIRPCTLLLPLGSPPSSKYDVSPLYKKNLIK